jgi:hypothetical protein
MIHKKVKLPPSSEHAAARSFRPDHISPGLADIVTSSEYT